MTSSQPLNMLSNMPEAPSTLMNSRKLQTCIYANQSYKLKKRNLHNLRYQKGHFQVFHKKRVGSIIARQ